MAKAGKTVDKKGNEGSKVLTVLIALLIVLIWIVLFAFLIKLDVGGFGSGVLRPILKDVPIVNMILPQMTDPQIKEEDSVYKSLPEAIARIRELEQRVEDMQKSSSEEDKSVEDLRAEIERLKVFEENQLEFEKRQQEFDKKVVFAEAAPDINEYKTYYEEINPVNAEIIYRQVVEQLQYSDAVQEKARIFKSMEPKAAARIMETMTADVGSIANILLSMKPKESAAIMAEMDSVVAARITKKMLDMDEERLSAN